MRHWLQIVLMGILLMAAAVGQQPRGKRLMLKDGSFQLVTKWEVKGDRVRYMSAERYQWEEMPSSLVDWKATEEAERLAAPRVAAENTAAEDKEKDYEPPEVVPGLKLPDQSGVFLLDEFKTQPQLVEIVQTGSERNRQTGSNILRSIIIPIPTGVKQSIEVPGAKAKIQSHVMQPAIYLNVLQSDDSGAKVETSSAGSLNRFSIIKVQKKGDHRIVANVNINLVGDEKEKRSLVQTRSEVVNAQWMKLTPVKPLEPGEYAIVEIFNDDRMNLYVWDFGVDPNAAANPTAWKPEARSTKTATDQTPVLRKK